MADHYLGMRSSIDGLLADTGAFLADLLDGHGQEDDGEHCLLIDQQLQHFFTSFYQLKQRHDEGLLSVAVLALIKSGERHLEQIVDPIHGFTPRGRAVHFACMHQSMATMLRGLAAPALRCCTLTSGSGATPAQRPRCRGAW